MCFPDGLEGKESACNTGDLGWEDPLDPERNGYPFQHSCLENPNGQSSLPGFSPGGHKESDMTD